MNPKIVAAAPLVIAQMLESDGPGGAEILLSRLSVALRSRGCLVVPVGPRDGCGWLGRILTDEGFEIEGFSLRKAVDLRGLADLVRMMQRRKVTAIHSHEFTLAVYGAACAEILRLPHVITLHGTEAPWSSTRNRMAFRWAVTRSTTRAVVAVSEEYRSRLVRGLGLPPSRFTVVPNGVPERVGDRKRGRREMDVQEGDLTILSVGRLEPVKGYPVLLRALSSVVEAGGATPWQMRIAGTGSEEQALRKMSLELGLESRVRFLGMRDDIPDLMAGSDLFVMPSLSEGLPLSLLEAMLAGNTVVASNCGGIPEVIQNGINGILFDVGDSEMLGDILLNLLGEENIRRRLAESARVSARHGYSMGMMTDKYVSLYDS